MGRFALCMLVWFCCLACCLPVRANRSQVPAGDFPLFAGQDEERQDEERRTVRIGLLEPYGFFHSRDNALRGYMPALFEGMGQLAGWKVEWVSVSLDRLSDALTRGEIDLACGVIWTPERASIYQYSSIRAGMYATTLRVPEKSSVHYRDFSEFNGLRIGFFEGSHNVRIFERQAKLHGFTYTPVLYRQAESLQRDFRSGKIDAYVDGSLFGEGKVVAVFDMRPFYFVSAPGDTRFMPRINAMLSNLQILTPQQTVANFANQYVDVCKNMKLALNREEEAWLAGHPKLRVAVSEHEESTTRRKYDYFLLRFVERLAKSAGIGLEYVPAPDYDACLTLLREGKADMVTNVFPSRHFREKFGVDSGLPYYSPVIELAAREKVEPGSGLRVGVTKEMRSVREAYSFIYPKDRIQVFDSILACRAALARGDLDAYIPFYPGVPHSKNRAGGVSYQSTQALYPMALGFSRQLPAAARSIFSKAIAGFSTAEVESLLLEVAPLDGLPLLTYLLEQYYGIILLAGGALFLGWAYSARREVLRLRRVAYTDSVTGGGNLSCFLQKAGEALRERRPCYIVSVNIRQLGQINQLYGYERGDGAIRACYAALTSCGGEQDLAAHSGRGRFLCLWHCDADAEVETRLKSVFGKFAAFGDELGHIVILSVGIVRVTPELGDDVPRLVEAAETAKNSLGDVTYKSHYAYYSPEIEQERLLISHIENRMEAALEKGEFQVYVQPQVELASGRISGGEALVRWRTAAGNVVAPSSFIPIFEKNGFVQALDLYMLEQVCGWLRKRLDAGGKIAPVSINQSRSLFLSQRYCDRFLAVLDRYALPRPLVTVEITESMADCDMELLLGNLRLLKKNDIRIALDDFGKGYSSLSTLLDFPIDVIKLDKDFLNNERYESLLTPLLLMSRNLGLKVLCEGIETREQYERLRNMGCGYGQGFFMARPMPLREYEEFLEKGRVVVE